MKTVEKTTTGRILVLGLGNTIVSDDGVGIYIAERFRDMYSEEAENLEVVCSSKSGFELLPSLEGYEAAVVVDAIKTSGDKPGSIYEFELEKLSATAHSTSPHSLNLYTTIELGKTCGLKMPERVRIIAVEIEDNVNFGERCTPDVEASIDKAVEKLREIINNFK